MQLRNLAGNSRKARGCKFQIRKTATSDDLSRTRVLVRGTINDSSVTDKLLSRMSLVQLTIGDDDRRPTPTDTYLTDTVVQCREVSCTSV